MTVIPAVICAVVLASNGASFDHQPTAALAVSAQAQSDREIDAIMARPESVEPMAYLAVITALWERGDREQATFWYYLWQIRTRAWSKADTTVLPLRGAVMETLGRPINEWAASDVESYLRLVERVIAFERRLPLTPNRPGGVTKADWERRNQQEREIYEAEFRQATSGADFGTTLESHRRENGLYVGPWQDPGRPIPAEWLEVGPT